MNAEVAEAIAAIDSAIADVRDCDGAVVPLWQLHAARLSAAARALRAAVPDSRPTAHALLLGCDQFEPDGRERSFRFVVPTPPSAKNAKVLSRGTIRTRHDVLAARDAIREVVFARMRRLFPEQVRRCEPVFDATTEVGATVIHNTANETVDVDLRAIGRRRPKAGRKVPEAWQRDVANVPELILDAIQRFAYANDRQVGFLTAWRNSGTPTTVTQ